MLLAVAFTVSGCSTHTESQETPAVVQDQLREAFKNADEVNVIVNFRDTADRDATPEQHREAIRNVRERVLNAAANGFVLTHKYNDVPAVAGRLSRTALEALSSDHNVSFIQIDEIGHGALKVSVPAIKADVAQQTYNVTGQGVTVAVLDSGVNTAHLDLKSSVSATQYCVTHNACPPNNAATGTSAEDDNGHGSNIAGIITSDGVVAGIGFAPNAQIVAVKIDDKNDSGYVSDWIAGLQWVYDNLSTLKVKLINMSICSTTLYDSGTSCDSGQSAFETIVDKLVKAGVTIFAASGNDGSNNQMSAPACLTGVIAVGATYKSNQGRQPQSGSYAQWSGFGDCTDTTTAFDQIACFTNSNSRLDMVAPGAVIESDYLGGTQALSDYRGTSQATPTATGVAALMLECNPNLTPAQVKSLLVSTAVTISDPKNNLSFPSLRADAAVKAACTSTGGTSGTGGASSTGGVAAMGGKSATGGNAATGGKAVIGGSSSALASGGNYSATGGTSPTGGGKTGAGGSAATGGSSAATNATGGISSATGGTKNGTGGTSASSTALSTGLGGASGLGGGAASGGSWTISTGGAQAISTGGAMGAATTSSATTSSGPASNDNAGSCACRAAGSSGSNQSKSLAGLAALVALVCSRRRQGPRYKKPA